MARAFDSTTRIASTANDMSMTALSTACVTLRGVSTADQEAHETEKYEAAIRFVAPQRKRDAKRKAMVKSE